MTFLDLSENWGHRTIHQYFFEYINTKVLNKMLANWIQQNSKRIPHQDQVSFIPEVQRWFNTHTQKNYVIYAINKIRKTNKQTWSSQLMQKKHLKKSNTLSWFKKKKKALPQLALHPPPLRARATSLHLRWLWLGLQAPTWHHHHHCHQALFRLWGPVRCHSCRHGVWPSGQGGAHWDADQGLH